MYIVSQIYHDPNTHEPLDTAFIESYTIFGIFEDFQKAVECAKQINKDFEADIVCNRANINYKNLSDFLNTDNVIQEYKENFNQNFSYIENKIVVNDCPTYWCEYSKVMIDSVEVIK